MRLGLTAGYSGAKLSVNMDLILEAERLGFDSVWTAEAYGSDAATPLAYIAALTERIRLGTAIFQMPARTPAMTAMTAMTLDSLSGGRFILGLGPSGPQVVEGWHGVAYGRPLTRTREYIRIVRDILKREAPLEHEGFHYQIPYRGEGATGLGKPQLGQLGWQLGWLSSPPRSLSWQFRWQLGFTRKLWWQMGFPWKLGR